MSISFTKSIVNQLQKEIADIESKSQNEKKKIDKAQAKLKQIQKDMKLSQSASDLSNKMSRINKLNEEIKNSDYLQKELAKTLVAKKASLKQNLARETKKDEKY